MNLKERLASSGAGLRAKALRTHLGEAHGPRGKLAVLRVLVSSRLKSGEEVEPVPVPMSKLGGEPMHVRPGTTDLANATAYLAEAVHLPPAEVGTPKRIVELGSNMGAGITALAFEYPDAELVGVEPDPGNLAMARRNTERFGGRVRIIESAIWDREASLVIDLTLAGGEHGFRVREAAPSDADLPRIAALSIDDLLSKAFPGGEDIDYMHVTIEGSERRVFAAGGDWPQRVRSLRVEAHPYLDYPIEELVGQLEALGYNARAVAKPHDKWAFAVR